MRMPSSLRVYVLGLALVVACPGAAEGAVPDNLVTMSIREGDRCLISGVFLSDKDGVAFLHRGRRVTVHKDAVGMFFSAPQDFFSSLQPRGALFQEDETWSLGLGWLYVGVWMCVGLASGALASHIAIRKGYSALLWFAAGLIANVAALAAIYTRRTTPDAPVLTGLFKPHATHAPLPCPTCGRGNHPAAASCSSCGAALTPAAEAESQRIGGRT